MISNILVITPVRFTTGQWRRIGENKVIVVNLSAISHSCQSIQPVNGGLLEGRYYCLLASNIHILVITPARFTTDHWRARGKKVKLVIVQQYIGHHSCMVYNRSISDWREKGKVDYWSAIYRSSPLPG